MRVSGVFILVLFQHHLFSIVIHCKAIANKNILRLYPRPHRVVVRARVNFALKCLVYFGGPSATDDIVS